MGNKIIIGPTPPAIGGIATIVQSLKEGFSNDPDVKILSVNKTNNKLFNIFHSAFMLIKILFVGIKSRQGTVLMFSSAYNSFWEKCLWVLICKILGLHTTILMVDGNFPSFYSGLSRLKKLLAIFLIKQVNVLAVQSKQWEIFYHDIFPLSNIKIVNPGIDTNYFHPRIEQNENKCLNILFVGWLISDKGIYDLLNAIKIIDAYDEKFKLFLLGPDFGNKNHIIEFINKHNLEGLVEFKAPTTSRESILKAYHSADIFVFPSHFEGFPYALMEAISCGLPCIGTRVGGIPDILDDGKCGILIEAKKPKELANALIELIRNKEQRKKISHNARERAVTQYSLRKSFNDFKDILFK